MTDDFISGSRAIAAEMGVSQWLVLDLVRHGNLPAFQRGNALMARRSSLHKWMEAIEQLRAAADLKVRADATIKATMNEARALEQSH